MKDRERAERAVALHSRMLLRLAFSYLHRVQDAEDAVQEAFLSYLTSSPEFSTEESERAWLARVTVNRCKSMLRSAWMTRRTELSEDIAALPEEEGDLLRAVLALPEKYRLPVHLFYSEGYSIAEIASMTGLKPATVGTRLARGRERLKKLIGGFDSEE